MLIKFILKIYKYMLYVLFPSIENNIERYNSSGTDDGDESNDMVPINYQVFDDMNKYVMQHGLATASQIMKKSQSYSIKNNYYCGFCSRTIISPEHMYNDKPYCSLICRNNQIQQETSNFDPTHKRERHSFSI